MQSLEVFFFFFFLPTSHRRRGKSSAAGRDDMMGRTNKIPTGGVVMYVLNLSYVKNERFFAFMHLPSLPLSILRREGEGKKQKKNNRDI